MLGLRICIKGWVKALVRDKGCIKGWIRLGLGLRLKIRLQLS